MNKHPLTLSLVALAVAWAWVLGIPSGRWQGVSLDTMSDHDPEDDPADVRRLGVPLP
jgi:ABC-type dipeptide/oligopeptide/nickel transport system permease component